MEKIEACPEIELTIDTITIETKMWLRFVFYAISNKIFAIYYDNRIFIFNEKNTLHNISDEGVYFCQGRLLDVINGKLCKIDKKDGSIQHIKTFPLGVIHPCFFEVYDDVSFIAILLRKNHLLLYDLDGNLISNIKDKNAYQQYEDADPFLLSYKIFSPYTKKWLPFPNEYLFVYRTNNVPRTKKRPSREYFLFTHKTRDTEYILCDENMNIVGKYSSSSSVHISLDPLFYVNGKYYDMLLDTYITPPSTKSQTFFFHKRKYNTIIYQSNNRFYFCDSDGNIIYDTNIGSYSVSGYDHLYMADDKIINMKTTTVIENATKISNGIYDEEGRVISDVEYLLAKQKDFSLFPIRKQYDSGFHCYCNQKADNPIMAIFDSFGNEIVRKQIKHK